MADSFLRLYMFDLPLIEDLDSLSKKVRISKKTLYRLSKYNSKHYKKYPLPKKNGKERIIFQPSREMKAVQTWILKNILDRVRISNMATAFSRGRNILDNALIHKDNLYFLCLDIDNFFPSITYRKIFSVFRSIGYKSHISYILTNYCTCEGILPQGAITSPALSNIVCIKLDRRLSGYVGRLNITYSRYADDMVFSCNRPDQLPRIWYFVKYIIESEGFRLNKNKTRYLNPGKRRKITGIVISDNSLGIGRARKRILRAKIHRYFTKSLSNEKRDELRSHIEGWLAFISSVDSTAQFQLANYIQKFKSDYNLRIPDPRFL